MFTLKRIDQLASIHRRAAELAADQLEVKSFGLQMLDCPGGFADYPEHDRAVDGQEEVYVIGERSARFAVAGERGCAAAGSRFRVGPDSARELVPGPHGVRILVIGCAPGRRYERPNDFELALRA
jgi:hypothetical protein